MLVHPQFDPVALSLGPVQIHWYGLTYLLAFALFLFLAIRRVQLPHYVAAGWTRRDVEDMLFYGVLGVIVGGRLGYALFYKPGYYLSHPLEVFMIWKGGMSFHGGLIGVMVALALFAVTRKRPFLQVMDVVAPCVPTGYASGRMGNFINGELWGKQTEVAWGFQVNGEVRHATQLYEAALEGLLLFVLLWWFTSRPRPRLAPSGLFLVLYGGARILIEFWREPDAQIGYLAGGWVTMGQLLSLPMLIVGLILLWFAYTRNQPSGNRVPEAVSSR